MSRIGHRKKAFVVRAGLAAPGVQWQIGVLMASTRITNQLTRFSDRVEDYVKYRPGYPRAVLDFFIKDLGLIPTNTIADIGSGTGIFSRLLLQGGYQVIGVEPNREMRDAAERLFKSNPRFRSVGAQAEETGLSAHSVDCVTVAQAFHWFDHSRFRKECLRIIRPGGWTVLVWNMLQFADSRFGQAYEKIKSDFGIDYQDVKKESAIQGGAMDEFFGPAGFQKFSCPNEQRFDLEGLKGRLLSSSYIPAVGHPNFEPMMKRVEAVLRDHQQHGEVRMEYETIVFYAALERR